MANRISQAPVEVALVPTSEQARVTQLPVEVGMLPSPNARLSQLPVEAIWTTVPGALLSQIPVEVAGPGNLTQPDIVTQLPVEVAAKIIGNGNPTVTQVVAEPVTVGVPTARVTQAVAETTLYPTSERARITQAVLEVIHKTYSVTILVQNNCWIAVQTDFPLIAVPAN